MPSNKTISNEGWTTLIRPKENIWKLDIAELWQYRDLLYMFVKRDIVTFYKQTILGPIWFFIQPVFTTIIYMFVFGGLAKISTDSLPQPLFYMAGIICWNYFSDCLTRTSTTFIANANVFGKVYFPRLIIPFSVVISNVIRLFIQLSLFLLLYLYFVLRGAPVHANAVALLFPLLILLLACLGLGLGLAFSSMTTKYRDLTFLLTFGVQLWMYATPVIYPLSTISDKYKWIVVFNPLTAIIETFRYGFLGQGTFSLSYLMYSFIITMSLLIIGIITFNKVQRSFMDVV
jgi:ABC-type polysaccharide/polyol phosphate export systems, permease component